MFEYKRKMVVKFAVVVIVSAALAGTTGFYQSTKIIPYEEEWSTSFGPGSFSDIVAVHDGYFVVGGAPVGGGNGWDGRVIKIDKNGNKIWDKVYDMGGNEGFDNVIKIDDGCIIQGVTDFKQSGEWNIWIIKMSEGGSIVWEKVYGDRGEYQPEDLAGTKDAGFAIGGNKIVGNLSMISLLKFNKNGEKEWEQTYYYNPGLLPPHAKGVVQTHDGGYAISGEISREDATQRDLLLLKVDGYGNEMFNRTYGQEYYSLWQGNIIETSDGGLLLNGMAFPTYGPLSYTYLVKTDAVGNPQWEREYHGRHRFGEEKGAGIADLVEISQGYVFTTSTEEVGKDGSGWLVKIDRQGDELWNKTFGDMYGCAFSGGVVAAEDGYVACGYWNRTAWVTKCGDYPPPKIELTHPRPGHVYLFDREIMPAQRTLILGDITFQVEVDDPLDKVDRIAFYVTTQDAYDKEPRHIDYEPPYEWEWDSPAIGIRWHYRIIVAAYYGNAGGSEADEISTQVVNFGLT